MIRRCQPTDIDRMFFIINEAAKAYDGVIPPDCYCEPYMPMEELKQEVDQMTFFGWETRGELVAVMGLQTVEDVTLVRHAYVLPDYQRRGIGNELLSYLTSLVVTSRLLVGTWAAASWAIDFYEKHGFSLMTDKDGLLRKYWNISWRQTGASVVLGMDTQLSATVW